AAPHLLPKERREIESDEVIESAARLLRVHELRGDVARLGDRVANRVPSDLIENDAMDPLAAELTALLENLGEMPGDRLAFAVGIGREQQSLRLAQAADDGLDVALALLEHLVLHGEAAIGVDRTFLRHEVANMPVGGEHLEVLAQVLLDGACLGGRFHYDQIVGHEFFGSSKRKTAVSGRGASDTPDRPPSVRGARGRSEREVFHARERLATIGLARQHHQHHPFELLGVELVGIECEHALDHDLALLWSEYAEALERHQKAAALGGEPRELALGEDANRARHAAAHAAADICRAGE